MIDQLIAQLKHPDPERRRQAIIALGKSKSMAAIRPLAEVFKNDSSQELRELARKAAQYIRAQNAGETPAAAPPPPPPPPAPTTSPFTTSLDDDDLPDPLSFRLPQEPPPPAKRGSTPAAPRRSVIRSIVDDAPRGKGAAAAGAGAIGGMGIGGSIDQFEDPDLDMLGLVNEQGYYRGDGPLYDDDTPVEEEIGDMPFPGEEQKQEDARKVAIPIRGREYNVPYDDRQRAKGYVDGALTANMSNDNARAMKLLAQALSINPNLINDGFYNSVASQVTGLDGDGAIQMIVDSQQRKSFVKTAETKKKQARVEQQLSRASESNWGSVTFELVIYAIISFLAPVLLTVVFAETARTLPPEQQALLAAEGSASMDVLTAPLNIGLLLATSLVGGILGVLSVFFQSGIIHGIARAFGAIGTFPHLLTVLLRFYNRFLPIFYTLVGAFIVLSLLTIGSPLPVCGSLILSGFALYMFFRTAGTIGTAYDRGAGFGCVTLFVSGIVLAIINGVIGYLVGVGILNSLAAAL